MKFIFDIDHTIFTTSGHPDYEIVMADDTIINIINDLFENGHEIIIQTGRHWNLFLFTKKQLDDHFIKYHSLIMGKVPGIIIDDLSYRPDEFIKRFEEGGF